MPMVGGEACDLGQTIETDVLIKMVMDIIRYPIEAPLVAELL
jgi:hypothetical protein